MKWPVDFPKPGEGTELIKKLEKLDKDIAEFKQWIIDQDTHSPANSELTEGIKAIETAQAYIARMGTFAINRRAAAYKAFTQEIDQARTETGND